MTSAGGHPDPGVAGSREQRHNDEHETSETRKKTEKADRGELASSLDIPEFPDSLIRRILTPSKGEAALGALSTVLVVGIMLRLQNQGVGTWWLLAPVLLQFVAGTLLNMRKDSWQRLLQQALVVLTFGTLALMAASFIVLTGVLMVNMWHPALLLLLWVGVALLYVAKELLRVLRRGLRDPRPSAQTEPGIE